MMMMIGDDAGDENAQGGVTAPYTSLAAYLLQSFISTMSLLLGPTAVPCYIADQLPLFGKLSGSPV